MTRTHLEAANRALIRAIETPPDTGIEPRLDRIAGSLWALARRECRPPDPERLRRLQRELAALRAEAAAERAGHIDRALVCVRAHRASAEVPV
ncbi:hypothetical protein ACFQPA_18765 [Halomarina halobia]|uniref:Uncharacterized protein n=1 Tax=Halomarina halobia TaxID=3033386 RepID=A0ABD6ACJ7_9EURY|nr:hypothetical protein [Halomarina sp. PSR21]